VKSNLPKTIQLTHNGNAFFVTVDDRIELWSTPELHSRALTSDDFATVVYDSLMRPIDYPPVASGVVPGDIVAIVIDSELPCPDGALKGVLRALSGLELSRIDVVISESANEDTRAAIRRSLPSDVELTIHSGKSRDDLRYLAANEAADPIYLNRRIVDADLVIPVFAARQTDPLTTSSGFCPVFPSLADYRSQGRARINATEITTSTNGRRGAGDDEASRVGWLLGLQWMVSVDVTADGKPGAVCVGTSDTLAARSLKSQSEIELPAAADVVIATVEGGPQQHSLVNLLRAALVARGHASIDASIVLITDLDELGSLDEFAGESYDEDDSDDSEFIEDGEREPNQAPVKEEVILSPIDYARQMLSILINDMDSSRRYLLLANCSEEDAEAFGFGSLKDANTLSRLIDGHESCIVIRHSQLVSPRV